MNHKLKENVFNFISSIERNAKLSVIDEIENRLMNKLKVYNNLLYSREAEHIYFQVYGKKWEKMRELRYRLQAQERTIQEICGMIGEIRYNEVMNTK